MGLFGARQHCMTDSLQRVAPGGIARDGLNLKRCYGHDRSTDWQRRIFTLKDELLEAAKAVREKAYAPYSGFKVGAAIRSAAGIHVGCNVENAAYPEGICAEGGAITSMVAAGDTEIFEVLVYAEADTPVAPCGGCRQKLAEFAGPDVVVRLAGADGVTTETTMADLLPAAFGAAQLK